MNTRQVFTDEPRRYNNRLSLYETISGILVSAITLCVDAQEKLTPQTLMSIGLTADDAGDYSIPSTHNPFITIYMKARVESHALLQEAEKTITEEDRAAWSKMSAGDSAKAYIRKCDLAASALKVFSSASYFFADDHIALTDEERALVDAAYAGVISALVQDPVFPIFRRKENRDAPMGTVEERMTEELDRDSLVKYLGGQKFCAGYYDAETKNPHAISWRDLNAYAYVLPQHHRRAQETIIKHLGALPEPSAYFPQEILIRTAIDYLQSGGCTQQQFDEDVARIMKN